MIVTVLGLVGGAPGGETPRVADSSAAGAGRFFHNSVPPSKLNRLGKPPSSVAVASGSKTLGKPAIFVDARLRSESLQTARAREQKEQFAALATPTCGSLTANAIAATLHR